MNVNKELVKEIIETDELDERMNKFYDLVNELMAENTVRDLAECAAEHIIHSMAVPKISVTLTQFEEIEKMFKIKGQDGRGGDRRSKKFKSLKDEEVQKALELLNSKK